MPIIWKALASLAIFGGGFIAGAICNTAASAADDELREHLRKHREEREAEL